MRVLAAFFLLPGCLLSSCATQTITEQNVDQVMADFASGNTMLSSSVATWGNTGFFANQMFNLDTKQDWGSLAKLAIKANSATDLSWYMLGQSAEGLNFRQAAFTYYQQAIVASDKLCQPGSGYIAGVCNGLELPKDASNRLNTLNGD